MSAHTMRLLVKLSKEKQRKKEQHALSPNGNKKNNIRRGKTLTNVEATPEEIVARRISHIAAEKSPPPNELSTKPLRPTHIRSYSEPKDTIEDITNVNLEDAENDNENDNKQQGDNDRKPHHTNGESLSRDSDGADHDDNSHDNSSLGAGHSEDDSSANNNHSAMPSVGSQSVSATNESFASRTQSHTHTLSASHSNTQMSHTATNLSQISHSSQAPSIKNKFHGKNGKQEMSVASMSGTTTYSATHSQASTTVTVTDMSRQSNISNVSLSAADALRPTGAQPPALDTVSESHKSQDIEDLNDILSKTHSARHAKDDGSPAQLSGSYNNSNNSDDVPDGAPSVLVASDSEDTNNKTGTRGHDVKSNLAKVDENEQLNTSPNSDDTNSSNGSFLSMICCCFGSNNSNTTSNNNNSNDKTRLQSASAYGQTGPDRAQSDTATTTQPLASATTQSIELNSNTATPAIPAKTTSHTITKTLSSDLNPSYNNNSYGGSSLALDAISQTTATQRLRRPTQFSTVTKNEESTIEPSDVKLWDEPFGKGASGRVFKAVYLPLCQVLAVKVVNRLDNENVKQVLGEFRDQQELLPECDRLMRIWGWYRDLDKNTVVIALEYMDMGSIYDSCFPKDRDKVGDNLLNSTAEEQEKSGHKQIQVDKLTYDQLRFIAREALVGLHALHTCDPPLVHRDIKPQNILASSFGEIKVADFGLLKRVNRQTLRLSDQKGTEKYFSPERINKNYSTGSDIWALGITMIEIFNQELIPPDQLDWFKLVNEGIDITEFIPPTAPTEFVTFLRKCLCKDETKRPSAKELLNDKFCSRGWGNALDEQPNFSRKKLVQFADVKPDQKTLDKLLGWLETWILADENNNAKLFAEGDPEHLKACVYNLARFTGNTPEYIDRYIAEVYREHLNAK